MAVTEYETKFKRKKRGLCSTWLASQDPKTSEPIPLWFTKGTMKLPKPIPTSGVPPPVIMIGPGTGVAAFRSFIQYLCSVHPTQKKVLVFGCRSETKDYYYSDEWSTLKESSLSVLTAFSRDNPDGSKTYVQHVIREQASTLGPMIVEENAHIYVSGKAKNMPKSVEKAIVDVVKEVLKDEEAAKKYVQEMRKNGRYQQEVW
jgi:sulfite reductase alpha subunit-like flavoprotein